MYGPPFPDLRHPFDPATFGLHGIYPPELGIPQQDHSHLGEGLLPYLDILLVHTPTPAGRSRFVTRLYDKREQRAFDGVRLSRFVHVSSNVNEAAKRNLFLSQFHRLRRIIMDVDNFVEATAHVLVALIKQGYSQHTMLRTLDEQLFFNPQLFLVERRTTHRQLAARVRDRLAALVRDLAPPLPRT
ncbi:hypothetical protein PLESTF_000462700 [Pleodorina starrii]|nr:hypothetical protein PLESTF_000462700 [Pleodorina starrii]